MNVFNGYDDRRAYKRCVKTIDGYKENAIIIGVNHPCYNYVKCILDVNDINNKRILEQESEK
jgi:hypothetical protein